MKLRQMIPKRKLRATAVRRAPASRAIEDEEEEPTMRLSSAFVVVVLLHLVAIGGIITFEKVKVHRTATPAEETARLVGQETATTTTMAAAAKQAAPPVAAREIAAPAPAVAAVAHAPEVRRVSTAPVSDVVRDSGEVHTVVKGENPVAIAKKLGVNYEDLLKLNKIDDPRKLRPGQKLHIPAKAK